MRRGPWSRLVVTVAGGLALAAVLVVDSAAASGRDPAPAGAAHACRAPARDTAGSSRISMEALGREPMEATSHAPGGGGSLDLAFASSPYGLAVTADGRPRYRIAVETRGLRVADDRRLVAWAATPELDEVRMLGRLGEDGAVREGHLEWTRFLVFVTAEPEGSDGPRWEGPVLLVGRAPSTRMHTMRGHGIFEAHGIGC